MSTAVNCMRMTNTLLLINIIRVKIFNMSVQSSITIWENFIPVGCIFFINENKYLQSVFTTFLKQDTAKGW